MLGYPGDDSSYYDSQASGEQGSVVTIYPDICMYIYIIP